MWIALKAFFAGASVYKWLGIAMLVVGLLTGCYLAVTKAYTGVYQRGYDAAVAVEKARYQAILLAAQDKTLSAQTQLIQKTQDYGQLKAQFDAMQARGPDEVKKNVRQDPKFAASRRPAALHAQRVRELREIQDAAAHR